MPYIYLIHCRASVNANENVYKIGKSVDFNKRLDGYDKGSIPIFTIYVSECDDFERLLITIFRSTFIIRSDYGSEYFEGNVTSMINTIVEEYNKTELSYTVSTIGERETLQRTETPNNIIKTKMLLKNKLNKITLQTLNDFQNNITMHSTEIVNNQYFCMLQNNIQNYRMDKQSGRTKLKFGDYLEYNYAFINNLCYSLSTQDTSTIKLIERIKISI